MRSGTHVCALSDIIDAAACRQVELRQKRKLEGQLHVKARPARPAVSIPRLLPSTAA